MVKINTNEMAANYLIVVFLILNGSLAGSPRDIVQIANRIDDEQQVHGGHGQVVDYAPTMTAIMTIDYITLISCATQT